MARILVLSLVFAPDGVSTAALVSELAYDLQKLGHEVSVLTTQPHYNVDVIAREKQPLIRRWGGLYYKSVYHGIPVWHVAMRPKGERALGRIIDFIFFHVISIILGVVSFGKEDVVLAVSPPLTIGVVGWLLALSKGASLIYNVQELYPDTAVKSGFMREGTLIVKFFEHLETFIYKKSRALAVICSAFYKAIAAKNIPPDKIWIIPNFVDVDTIISTPESPLPPILENRDLSAKFIVLYAGNIGRLQKLDTLIDVAHRLRHELNIVFMIVGDGADRTHIESRVAEGNLDNVLLMPYQPRDYMPAIYAGSDICFVPLMAGTAQTAAPSKLYVIMASGKPALLAVDKDSDLVRIVEDANCGIAVAPDDADALEAGIRQAYMNPELMRVYGSNGRRYAVEHFSRKVISLKYHELLLHLVSK